MEFNQNVLENLGFYVYALVDPRDNKIFYIGKGTGNRVFQHEICAVNEDADTLKYERIRDIKEAGQEVKHYIIRHGMTEEEAFLVESVLINVFTYDAFNLEKQLTNIQNGHHESECGIMTDEQLNLYYNCEDIVLDKDDKILCININKTYNRNISIYDATRMYWRVNIKRAEQATKVLAIYRGVVRAAFKPTQWFYNDESNRWGFEGVEIEDSPYRNKNIKNVITCGQNPLNYINI